MDTAARRRARALVVGTLLASMIIWAARRPDQLLHPYAWVEEATMIDLWQRLGPLRQAVTPINGQLILSSSASVGALLSLDFLSFPALAYVAASLWFLALLLLWLCVPSRLPLQLRVLFVLAVVLVPASPETIGVLEYSFWWVTLWVVPCLFWDTPRWGLRLPVLVIAGLSSLTASTLFAAFALAWWTHRRVHDLVSTVILLCTWALQVAVYFGSPRSEQMEPVVGDILQQSFANLGSYLLGWLRTAQFPYLVFLGVVICGFAVGLALDARRRQSPFALDWTLLLLVLGVFTLLSSIPAPRTADPYSAGPRYFFLPFIGLSWLAAASMWGPWRRVGRVGATALALSLVTLAPAWSRMHEHLDWRQQVVTACRSGGDGKLPIHYDGSRALAWTVTLTRATCEEIVGGR